MEYIPPLVIGLFISILGIPNIKGNISSIHWYNRRKVTEEDRPKYGKIMGIATIIIGLSISLTAILLMIFNSEFLSILVIPGVVVGLVMMFYAQFKYNHGLF